MIRVAAVGDIHYSVNSKGRLREHFESLKGKADLLLIAGDLTQHGTEEEVRVLLSDLVGLPVPVICVLGNHDFHSNQQALMRDALEQKGIRVLEGDTAEVRVGDVTVGVAGVKGFGGGFPGARISDFGEPEMKAFACHSKLQAEKLRDALGKLKTDYRIALLHFAPIEGTLFGEKRELYPVLGCGLLGEALDRIGCDVAFHGHAHHGVEKGHTLGGIPVRNVAQLVIRRAYQIYEVHRR